MHSIIARKPINPQIRAEKTKIETKINVSEDKEEGRVKRGWKEEREICRGKGKRGSGVGRGRKMI